MIKTPKKQLSNLYFPAFVVCCVLQGIVLFLFSLSAPAVFNVIFVLCHILIIIVLFVMRGTYLRKQAEYDLKKQDYIEKINLVQAEIADERFALEATQGKIINYLHLKDLTESLSLCLTLEDTSRVLSSETDKLFGREDITTILYLFHSKTGELGLSASQKGQMQINLKSKRGDIFDEWVVKTLQPLLIEDTKRDFRFDMDKIALEENRVIRSLMSVPLMIGNKALGILRTDSGYENYFSTDDLRFLTTIAGLGAIAIENAQLYEAVEELAIKDGLTGLYLPRYLLSRLGEEISRQLRRKKQLSFLMIDLDKFKLYNDKYGHMAGDIVLKTISMILQESFSEPGNLVCRYGGEEFAVLLPDCPKEQAVSLAEEVRKRIRSQEIILRKQKTSISVSIGVATFPTDAQMKDELIHAADHAMYKAKKEGRNRVCSS